MFNSILRLPGIFGHGCGRAALVAISCGPPQVCSVSVAFAEVALFAKGLQVIEFIAASFRSGGDVVDL